MKLGMFMMPSHPPERSPFDADKWDLECIRLAEDLDFTEVWIGEHFTAPWEPVPSPDMLIARALMQTSRIRLGTGAHLLPFHHPGRARPQGRLPGPPGPGTVYVRDRLGRAAFGPRAVHRRHGCR